MLLCIVGLKKGLIRCKNIPLCWSGAYTRALKIRKTSGPLLLTGEVGGGGVVVTDK